MSKNNKKPLSRSISRDQVVAWLESRLTDAKFSLLQSRPSPRIHATMKLVDQHLISHHETNVRMLEAAIAGLKSTPSNVIRLS